MPIDLAPNAGALDRGLAIFAHLADTKVSTVIEIADALGLSRSTTYRLVDRLREQQWLTAEPGGGLRLGPAAARMASAAIASTSLKDVALPVLQDLLVTTQETVSLAVPNSLAMVFVHRQRGPRPVGVSAELGTSRPLHCSSVGRAYLSALPDEQRTVVFGELVASALSPITESDVIELQQEVERTAARGWSQDVREFDESSCCCGAPIFDHTGAVVAAISVAGVAERMEKSLGEVGPLVRTAAESVSAALGYVQASR